MDQQTRQLQREAASAQRNYIAAAGGNSCALARTMSEGNWLGVPNHLFDETLPKLGGAATCLLLALMEKCYEYDAEKNPVLSKEYVRTSDLRPDTGLSRPALRNAAKQFAGEDLLSNGEALLEQKHLGRGFGYRLTDAAGPIVESKFTKLPRAVCCMAADATGKEGRSDLRCLLVIVRKTIGFGKVGAIVTHEDFKAGSSIEHSETIGNATQRLVEKGLVARARLRPHGFDYPTYLYALCPRLCTLAEVAKPDREANRGNDHGLASDREANRGDDRKGSVVDREENSGDDRKGSELSERFTSETRKDDNRKCSPESVESRRHDWSSRKDRDRSVVADQEEESSDAGRSSESDVEENAGCGGKDGGRSTEALEALRADDIGMDGDLAEELVRDYGADRVLEVVEACRARRDQVRIPTPWIRKALQKEWEFDDVGSQSERANGRSSHPAYRKWNPDYLD